MLKNETEKKYELNKREKTKKTLANLLKLG
jgi:hypothetical protein